MRNGEKNIGERTEPSRFFQFALCPTKEPGPRLQYLKITRTVIAPTMGRLHRPRTEALRKGPRARGGLNSRPLARKGTREVSTLF